jgi:hypothetical protein
MTDRWFCNMLNSLADLVAWTEKGALKTKTDLLIQSVDFEKTAH